MSAQATLAGLFSPIKSQVWNDKLLWQPIAVHSIPKSLDYILILSKLKTQNKSEYIYSFSIFE